jgi:hypothetical protein
MREGFAAHGPEMSADLKNSSDGEPVGLLGGARTVGCDGAFILGSGGLGGRVCRDGGFDIRSITAANEGDWSTSSSSSSSFGEMSIDSVAFSQHTTDPSHPA